LKPLIWDQDLYEVALAHSKDMAAMQKVSHEGSDRSEPDERIHNAKIYASRTAENIAGDVNVVSAHTSLMQSLPHRENILDPEVTHGAAAVYERDHYLYVTEMFILKLRDYSLEEARKLILQCVNKARTAKQLAPLAVSRTLNSVAQSHLEVQVKMKALSPLLIMSALSKQIGSGILVNVYTTEHAEVVPDQVIRNAVAKMKSVGIGFQRTQGTLCSGSCYAIVLIFSANEPPPE
jgi:uncharacterized protein YkwD